MTQQVPLSALVVMSPPQLFYFGICCHVMPECIYFPAPDLIAYFAEVDHTWQYIEHIRRIRKAPNFQLPEVQTQLGDKHETEG